MKNQILTALVMLGLFVQAPVWAGEKEQMSIQEEKVLVELMEQVLAGPHAAETAQIPALRRILIVDAQGNRIREDKLAAGEDFCASSTLVPMIYRCEYLTTIGNTCYFLLPAQTNLGFPVKNPTFSAQAGNFQPAI
jgi:hypothetical protein